MNRTNSKKAAGAQKKPVSKGAAGLGRAVDRRLKDNSEKIALALVTGAMEGNVNVIRFIVQLANEVTESEEPAANHLAASLAKALAAEPEWKGEKAAAETAAASR
jgi:hypothetical protein